MIYDDEWIIFFLVHQVLTWLTFVIDSLSQCENAYDEMNAWSWNENWMKKHKWDDGFIMNLGKMEFYMIPNVDFCFNFKRSKKMQIPKWMNEMNKHLGNKLRVQQHGSISGH